MVEMEKWEKQEKARKEVEAMKRKLIYLKKKRKRKKKRRRRNRGDRRSRRIEIKQKRGGEKTMTEKLLTRANLLSSYRASSCPALCPVSTRGLCVIIITDTGIHLIIL